MPSPFPGMNPYFEQASLWQDFHTKFMVGLSERLVPLVRPRYFVLLERHVFIHEPLDEPAARRMRADLLVAASRPGDPGGAAVMDVDAPAHVDHPEQEVERVAYLEIRDRQGGDLVTIVELLSMANKRDDRLSYLAKRETVLGSPTHLVEIDLLRGGRPMPEANRPACDYSALVSRSEGRPRAGFWPIGLRDRLPVVPIPLRDPDPDARIDLQVVLDHVYDTSGYEDFIYRSGPEPPLGADDAAWAAGFVPAAS
jgi:hypothetical protein